MGADGGFIVKRSAIVSLKPETKGRNRELQWSQCAISHEVLSDPIVSDYKGRIYNKKSILELLLGETERTEELQHIQHIRDVVELDRELDLKTNMWLDPISRKSIEKVSVAKAFGYIVECGHIFPVELLTGSDCCTLCERSYTDYVVLNPATEKNRQHNCDRIAALNKLGKGHGLRPLKKTKPERKRKHDADENKDAKILHKNKH